MSEKGFTLVEIIISIAILGIVTISIYPVFTNAFNVLIDSSNKVKNIDSATNELIADISSKDSSVVNLTLVDKDNNEKNLNLDKYIVNKNYDLTNNNQKKVTIEYYKFSN